MSDTAFEGLDRGDGLVVEEVIEPTADAVDAVEVEAAEIARDQGGKFAKREVPDHVPKARFDEAVGKERAAREAAEARSVELEARIQRADKTADFRQVEAEIEALEKSHAKLLLDGDSEKAAAAMKDIRLRERQIAIAESQHMSAQSKDQAREEIRLELAIEKLEMGFDAFNPEHEAFDQGLVDMVLALQMHKMQVQRMTPAKALSQAANEVMGRFNDGGKKAEAEARGLAAAKGASDRKADQVTKNLATSRAQPGNMKTSGKDSDKGGESGNYPNGITPAEFAAMPESTKAKLRGDFI